MSGRATSSPGSGSPTRIWKLGDRSGRGWANQYVNVRMTSPDVAPLLVYAKAWTPGTNGVVTGKCVRAIIEDKKDFDKYKGKLAGTIVILGPDVEAKPITEAPYKRLSDDDWPKSGSTRFRANIRRSATPI